MIPEQASFTNLRRLSKSGFLVRHERSTGVLLRYELLGKGIPNCTFITNGPLNGSSKPAFSIASFAHSLTTDLPSLAFLGVIRSSESSMSRESRSTLRNRITRDSESYFTLHPISRLIIGLSMLLNKHRYSYPITGVVQ